MKDCFLAVESDYDGPHLDADGRVTKDFMFELLPYFENQKKLHKKYAYQVRRIDKKTRTFHFIQIILQILTYLKSIPSLVDVTVPAVSMSIERICRVMEMSRNINSLFAEMFMDNFMIY